MTNLNLAVLYVESVPASTAFYAGLLGQESADASPDFAMFVLQSGMRLGLWRRAAVPQAPAGVPRAGELVLISDNVDATHADWTGRGLSIAQPPIDAPFGRHFLALDPDGHRLRVMRPA
jgi:predicted enzyme related to lactoylglutathione lyase